MLNMGLFELLKFIGQSSDKCTSIFWPIQFSIKLLLCHMHTFCIRSASPLYMYIAKVYGNLKTFTFCVCVTLLLLPLAAVVTATAALLCFTLRCFVHCSVHLLAHPTLRTFVRLPSEMLMKLNKE